MELWFPQSRFGVFDGKSWFSLFFFPYLDLLCKRVSSSPCFGSAVVALFIKLDESLFQEEVRTATINLTLDPSSPRR
jgi:hypothetical protein